MAVKHRRSRGQALVEFVLVLPIILLLLGGAADMARVYFVGVQIADGSRQAALYASGHPPMGSATGPYGYTSAQLVAIASNNAGQGSGLVTCPSSDLQVTVGNPVAYGGDSAAYYQPIEVTCNLPLLTPVFNYPFAITSRIETLVVPTNAS